MTQASTISRKGRIIAPFAILTLAIVPALAEGISLTLPVDCTLGEGCYIQQYHDNNPKQGAVQDFACGALANDGHSGTDFGVPTLRDMAKGVAVVAAAPGRVEAVRDGMADVSSLSQNAPDLDGKDCGNGVRLSHGNGWETQYCHFRMGSVAVKPGASVEAGTPLGLIGMSGQASFPHVHFTVRKDGQTIDPFDPDQSDACTLTPAETLWQVPPPYQSGGLLDAGFADRIPTLDEVRAGFPVAESVPGTTPAMVVWGYLFNGLQGDLVEITLSGPPGQIGTHTNTLEKSQPFVMRAFGKRTPPQGWPKGLYLGHVRHLRGPVVLAEKQIQLRVE